MSKYTAPNSDEFLGPMLAKLAATPPVLCAVWSAEKMTAAGWVVCLAQKDMLGWIAICRTPAGVWGQYEHSLCPVTALRVAVRSAMTPADFDDYEHQRSFAKIQERYTPDPHNHFSWAVISAADFAGYKPNSDPFTAEVLKVHDEFINIVPRKLFFHPDDWGKIEMPDYPVNIWRNHVVEQITDVGPLVPASVWQEFTDFHNKARFLFPPNQAALPAWNTFIASCSEKPVAFDIAKLTEWLRYHGWSEIDTKSIVQSMMDEVGKSQNR